MGDSTRLECVRKVLTKVFPSAPFKQSINPDEAAVYGAAVLADFIQKGQLRFHDDGFENCSKAPSVPPKPIAPYLMRSCWGCTSSSSA